MSTRTVPATVKPVIPLLEYQRRSVNSTARFRWDNWSRQIGKSFTNSLRRIKRAVETGRLQVILSAGDRQSLEVMEKVRQHASALQIDAHYHEDTFWEGTSIKQRELRLPNRGRIIALPANPNTARGFTGDVFLDEFAMHQHDREIWAALLPTVMRGEGQLDVASTPKGLSNMFARLRDNAEFERTTVTIHDAVRDGLQVDVEALRRATDDDQIWRQEFECEFLDESTAFLTYAAIAACEEHDLPLPIRAHAREALPEVHAAIDRLADAGPCYAGWDVARRRDLSVVWVCAQHNETLRTVLVAEMLDLTYREQYDVLSRLLRLRNVMGCSIDATGIGGPLAEAAVEDFGSHRVDAVNFAGSVVTTAPGATSGVSQPVKNRLAAGLRVRVEDRSIRIPSSSDIRNDWHSIEKKVTTGGNIRFHADRNKWGHADRFWAAALCVDAAAQEAGSVTAGDVFSARVERAMPATDCPCGESAFFDPHATRVRDVIRGNRSVLA